MSYLAGGKLSSQGVVARSSHPAKRGQARPNRSERVPRGRLAPLETGAGLWVQGPLGRRRGLGRPWSCSGRRSGGGGAARAGSRSPRRRTGPSWDGGTVVVAARSAKFCASTGRSRRGPAPEQLSPEPGERASARRVSRAEGALRTRGGRGFGAKLFSRSHSRVPRRQELLAKRSRL
jgi:hypothetical protein